MDVHCAVVTEVWLAVRWLHLLAMAFFVGGQLLLAVGVVPVERRSPDPERLRAIAQRFGYGTLVALVVLLATGIAMATRFETWGDPTLHVKLGLVAVVAGLVAWHLRRPTLHFLQAGIFVASLAIVWLGISLPHA
jgi:uncharacterized membrane protein